MVLELVGALAISGLLGAVVGKYVFIRKKRHPTLGAILGAIPPIITTLLGITLFVGLIAFVVVTLVFPEPSPDSQMYYAGD